MEIFEGRRPAEVVTVVSDQSLKVDRKSKA